MRESVSVVNCALVIPVYNEESKLYTSIHTLHAFLCSCRVGHHSVVIADNGSTDGTRAIANRLARQFSDVSVVHIQAKGRGGALKSVWLASTADVLAYMDVDLSTGLSAYPAMVDALSMGGYDLAVGSRLLKGAATIRCAKRELLSRCYNVLVRKLFDCQFSDAQCGCKAITKAAAARLLPLVQNVNWFFDTELLILAERLGYRICDIPVQWVECSDSRVKIASTIVEDVRGLMRLHRYVAQLSATGLCGVCPVDEGKDGTASPNVSGEQGM